MSRRGVHRERDIACRPPPHRVERRAWGGSSRASQWRWVSGSSPGRHRCSPRRCHRPTPTQITLYFGLTRPRPRPGGVGPGRRPHLDGVPAVRDTRSERPPLRREPETIRGVRAAATALGMTATVQPSGVFARVRAPLGLMQRVFHVEFQQQFDNDVFAETYFLSPRSRLRLPARLRRYVREVVTTYARSSRAPAVETALPPRAGPATPARGPTAAGGPAPGRLQPRPGAHRLRARRGRQRHGGPARGLQPWRVGRRRGRARQRAVLRPARHPHAHGAHRRAARALLVRDARAAGGPRPDPRDGPARGR